MLDNWSQLGRRVRSQEWTTGQLETLAGSELDPHNTITTHQTPHHHTTGLVRGGLVTVISSVSMLFSLVNREVHPFITSSHGHTFFNARQSEFDF